MSSNLDIFKHQFEQSQQKLAELKQQAGQPHPPSKLFIEGLEELENVLEEGYVLLEELVDQEQKLHVAKRSLETDHQQYFELFNLAPDGYIVTDEQGLITQINLMAASLLNCQQNFLTGKPLLLLIVPTERKHFYTLLHELRQGHAQQNRCLHLQPYQGEVINASFTITVVHNYQSEIIGFRWLFRDLTAQQCAATALKASEQRYATLAAAVPVGIFRTDAKGHCLYVNERWCQISGLTPESALRDGWLQGLHPDDLHRVTTAWEQSVQQRHPFQLEFQFQHPSGTVKWAYGQAIPEKDPEGNNLRYVGSITDISDFKKAQNLIKHNALHDPLTNLPNRTLLLERLELNINKAYRHQNYSYAVLFLDLDRFKVINDSLGHLVGDRLLIAIAQKLQTHLRTIDLVARIGGDEFIILLEDISDPARVVNVTNRILADYQTPFIINGHTIFTSVSVGIVLGNKNYRQASDVIRDADIAMYRAKAHKHNSYKFFDAAMHQQSRRRLTLETDLRQALEQEEFIVYYQPIFDLANQQIVGLEALVRWQHPTRGLISPHEFIPIAEETGMIASLDRWMFSQACQQLIDWKHRFDRCCQLKMSINLSPQNLSNPDLLTTIDQTLAETGIDTTSIILEITESILIENTQQSIYILAQLASRGIQLSIDDFGTGYSSLNYLQELPVNHLKIDGAFVGQMQAENRPYQVISTILTLSHKIGLTVVAEGIETSEQRQQLQQLGCQLGQGYLLAPPLPAATIETRFLQHHH